MAEIQEGSTSSIPSIVDFGLKLSTTLQLYCDANCYHYRGKYEVIEDLAKDINSSASALRELAEVMQVDRERSRSGRVTVLKVDGVEEVERRAAQCEKVFSAVVVLVTKAGTTGWKGKMKAGSIDGKTLKATSLSRNFKWTWLKPRVKLVQDQIDCLTGNLLFILQVVNLASHQVCTIQRIPGGFEEEHAMRILSERLRRNKLKFAKTLVKRHKKTPSIASSSSNSLVKAEDVVVADSDVDGLSGTKIPVSGVEEGGSAMAKTIIEKTVSDVSTANPPPYTEAPNGRLTIKDLKIPDEKVQPKQDFLTPEPPVDTIKVPAKPKVAPPQQKKPEIADIKGEEIIVDASGIPQQMSKSTFESIFGGKNSWFKEIFGMRNRFFNDKESDSLEAFIILGDKKRLKVPFGHQRLKFGMKRMMDKKKDSILDDYASLPKHLHCAIVEVLKGAQSHDGRGRVCICFEVLAMSEKQSDQHILAFFSASGPPIKPIHLKDAVGRKYVIPWHAVEQWDDMRQFITQIFSHIQVIGPLVKAGQYDLIGSNGKIVAPVAWQHVARPGAEITMHMWPFSEPPRGMYAQPPPLPPPAMPRVMPPQQLRPPPAGPPPGQNFPRPLPLSRRSSFSTFSSVDSSALGDDSDIENEEIDLGVDLDYPKELELSEMTLSEVLKKWTNAIDVEGGPLESDYSYSSSSSYLSD